MTRRQLRITAFVVVWLLVFGYETFRHGYLTPLLGRPLPKLPLLFPPAGWIMFFQVDAGYGFAEVYALRGGDVIKLDPYRIVTARSLGYENLRRNILISALSADAAPGFCQYLARKFPDHEAFAVVYAGYPDVVNTPDDVRRQVMYRCP